MLLLEDKAGQIDDAVSQPKVPAQPQIRGGDGYLDAHGGDDERLVVGEADAMHEQGEVKIASLMRCIDPAQQAKQNHHERADAEGIDFYDHTLAPHEPVE